MTSQKEAIQEEIRQSESELRGVEISLQIAQDECFSLEHQINELRDHIEMLKSEKGSLEND